MSCPLPRRAAKLPEDVADGACSQKLARDTRLSWLREIRWSRANCFTDKTGKFLTGVWECNKGTLMLTSYPFDELSAY